MSTLPTQVPTQVNDTATDMAKRSESNRFEVDPRAAEFFGTEYSGFENIQYSKLTSPLGIPTDSTLNLLFRVPSFSIGTKWSLSTPKQGDFVFVDLAIFSSKQMMVLYDSAIRKLWIVPELRLVLQIAHIWATTQSDRDELLSKLPYVKPSQGNGPSVLSVMLESRETILRTADHPSGALLFKDLATEIMLLLDRLRGRQVTQRRLMGVLLLDLPRTLRGWEIRDVAALTKPLHQRVVRLDRKTGRVLARWQKERPLALTLMGRNLAHQPPPESDFSQDQFPVPSDGSATRSAVPRSDETSGNPTSQSQATLGREVHPQEGLNAVKFGSPLAATAEAPQSHHPIGVSDDLAVAESGDSSSESSGGASTVFSSRTGTTSFTQLSILSLEPVIWQLRRLIMGDSIIVAHIDAGVRKKGLSQFSRVLRESLLVLGEDLIRESTTKEQKNAGILVRLKARETSEMIIERFDADIQDKLEAGLEAEKQELGNPSKPVDSALQGLFIPDIADEDDVQDDEHLLTEEEVAKLDSTDTVESYIRHSMAWEVFLQRLALDVEAGPADTAEDVAKELAVSQPASTDGPSYDAKGKGLEKWTEEPVSVGPSQLFSPDSEALDEITRNLSGNSAESGDRKAQQPQPRTHVDSVSLASPSAEAYNLKAPTFPQVSNFRPVPALPGSPERPQTEAEMPKPPHEGEATFSQLVFTGSPSGSIPNRPQSGPLSKPATETKIQGLPRVDQSTLPQGQPEPISAIPSHKDEITMPQQPVRHIPKGFVERVDASHFRIKTRNVSRSHAAP